MLNLQGVADVQEEKDAKAKMYCELWVFGAKSIKMVLCISARGNSDWDRDGWG